MPIFYNSIFHCSSAAAVLSVMPCACVRACVRVCSIVRELWYRLLKLIMATFLQDSDVSVSTAASVG